MAISVTTWAAAGVGLALVALLGVQTVRLSGEKAAHATTRASYADERTKAAQAHAVAIGVQAAEYERRIGAKDDAIKAAQNDAATARTALARSLRAGDSLRDERTAYLARAGQTCSGAGAGPGGAPACPAAKLLDELFGQADSFAGDLAEAFERSYIAGRTCERQYESLTNPSSGALPRRVSSPPE